MLGRRGEADDFPSTFQLGNLNRERADAARRAGDEDRSARLEMPIFQQKVRGQPLNEQRRRGREIERVRQGNGHRRVNDRVRSVASALGQSHHPLADHEAGNAFTDPGNRPSDLKTGPKRRGGKHRIRPGTRRQVGEVDAASLDFDEHLPFSGRGRRLFAELELLRPAELIYLNEFHFKIFFLNSRIAGVCP